MKVRLLKTIGVFVGAGIIFLSKTNTVASINPTRAYEARQRMVSLLNKERNKEDVTYKYLAEQLCIYFKPPEFPDEELTFKTPFGVARIEIKSTKSVFITNGINEYTEIGKILDEVLTEEGRKRLAKIILEYLQTAPDAEYRTKTFNTYRFKNYNDFFDFKNEKSKFYFNLQPSEQLSERKNVLDKEIKNVEKIAKLNLRCKENKCKESEIKCARNNLKKLESLRSKVECEIFKNHKKKLEKAKSAANALCAILMVAEPNWCRSFDGGKHERALIRDIRYSGMTYTDAFNNRFVPATEKGGANSAYRYSTRQDESSEILESNYYSDDECDEYDLEGLYNL